MGAGALVQWLKLLALKVGDRGFEPHSGILSFKETKFSSKHARPKPYSF